MSTDRDGSPEAPDDPEEPSDLEPQEAFALVGHELRFAILRALWDAEDPLTFSELRRAVGDPDSGNFNYHLGRMVGPFVRRTGTEYELTVAGFRVMGAIESGAYHRSDQVGPVPAEGTCPDCGPGSGLEAVYEEDMGIVRCVDCGLRLFSTVVPPSAVAEYGPGELPGLFDRWFRALGREVLARICPVCSGRLDASLGSEFHEDRDTVGATFACRQCAQRVQAALSAFFVEHPAVVAFHVDHGRDPRVSTLWDDDPLRREEAWLGRDPPRAEVRFALDGETLVLTVDDSLSVVDAGRTSA